MNTTEKYENLVNESPVFFLNPETEPSSYEREKNKLVTNLYLYKTSLSSQYEGYGEELIRVCERCLKAYHTEDGPFTRYFNVAFSKELKKVRAIESIDDIAGGQGMTAQEKRILNAIDRFLRKHPGITADDLLCFPEQYTEQLDMSAQKIASWAEAYLRMPVLYGDRPDQDPDHHSTLFHRQKGGQSAEELYLEGEGIRRKIDLFEEEYLGSRVGSRELIGMKLTGMLAGWRDWQNYYKYMSEKAFFRKDLFLRLIQRGEELSNREIGTMIGKSEQNISQIWKKYLGRLQIRIQGYEASGTSAEDQNTTEPLLDLTGIRPESYE